ncbi:MAG: type II toxin-antitoxin system RelE/ParE family toxin [gamma proteobacterium symbiont of Taylorina sp.]|nr:type II toxin-antitoxin system RelE/ParE family toxin [gamma proteobacterium symbiont of Taylorina sp.]
MLSFIFTDKAETDLADIIDFTLEQWGAENAHKYINGLEETAQMLADNPDIGIKRGNLLEELLCFPYESHVLYYYKQLNKVVIIRVLHQNMEPENHL